MSEFHAAYPDYATTSRLDDLRAAEYSYLDGHTYLDYTGAGLAADAQLRAHARRLRGGCFGNPHSENPTSAASTRLVEQARTVDDYLRLTGLPTGGAVRVSLGLASDLGDLDRFLDWAERTYRDAVPDRDGLTPRLRC